MTAADRLDEIVARAAAATDGPWWTEFWLDDLSWREGHYSVLAKRDDPVRIVDPSWETSEEQTKADGEFIAHARTDVPWLIEQVRKRDAALRAVLNLEAEYALAAESGDPGHARAADVANYIRRAVEAVLGEVAS